MTNVNTIILFGGQSDERHVSVASAQNVVRLLGRPLCWFWAPNGAVHDVSPDELLAHRDAFERDYVSSRPAIWPDLEQALDTLPVENPVFLLALHGGTGEDGTVQRKMEERRIAFTGSGSSASATAFDKARAKAAVDSSVPIAESCTVERAAEIRDAVADMLGRHSKIVLKPLAGGSSRGLFFVDPKTELDPIFQQIAESGVPYVIEEFIAGRELTVGIADMGVGPFALPVIEIEVDPGFAFDYAGKYLGKGTREICPANIPDTLRDEAQRIALEAHRALGCDGYSRSDLIAGDDRTVFLELNTLPGLTTSSLVPQQLRAAGIDMKAFLEQQIALAVRRRDGAV
jgi:D-alanine-D-alanine ligase